MSNKRYFSRKPAATAHARIVAKLAFADVCHEWRMSLCMILAVAAIATPLLLFFGLKNGTMETLQNRLLENPVNLEILPSTEKTLETNWFTEIRQDDRVGFVVPHTRKLSAQVEAKAADKNNSRRLDARPTGEGDVLLMRYQAPIPKTGECVLTAAAMEKLGVQPGQDVIFTVTRDSGRNRATRRFHVVGALPPQASPLLSAYILLEDLERIENYKDGYAVPAWDWPGTAPAAHPEFARVLLLPQQPLDPLKRVTLLENTGFATLKKYGPDRQRTDALPWQLPADVWELSTLGSMADASNLVTIRNKMRGIPYLLVPLGQDLELKLLQLEGTSPLRLAPATAEGKPLPSFALPAECKLDEWSSLQAKPVPRLLLTAPELAEQAGTKETLVQVSGRGKEDDRAIVFPVRLIPCPGLPQDTALAPLALLGTMNLLHQRSLSFEQTGGKEAGARDFMLGRRGYSSFRMYAATLEDVVPLAALLESMDIKTVTRADRIAEVRSLNTYLSLLFWLIASASIIGGIACLTANIYASVERKRRELAVLRLLGVHGLPLSLFPLVTISTLCCTGLAVALTLFHVMAALTNFLFRQHLEPGETFIRLSWYDQGATLVVGLLVSLLAGLLACQRMARIQPSESLRDE